MRRALSLLLLLALLAGCAGETAVSPAPTESPAPSQAPETAEERPFTLAYYPAASLHPAASLNRTNLTVISLLYETLFQVDAAFEVQPGLCESAAVDESGLVWTLTLRAGARFSDGSAVTAEDAAASLEAARQEGSRFAARLAGVTEAAASGDRQVTVTLSAPNGALPSLLDVPVFRQTGEETVGSGPYRLTGTGEEAALTVNPWYPQAEDLPFEEIALYPISQADTLVSGFESRDISLVNTDLTGSGALGFSGNFSLWEYPTSILQYLGFHTTRGPCRDPALRRAVSLAVDRSAVAGALLSHHAQASPLPIHPASPWYDQELADSLAFDLQGAQALLEEAGYVLEGDVLTRNGSPVALTLAVNSDSTFRLSVAEYAAQCLERLGIAVTVEAMAWDDYVSALERGSFDLYLAEVRLTADFDLTALASSGGALNYGGYASGETDGLLAAYRAASGGARAEAASALLGRLAEDMPFAPLCFKNNSVLSHWGRLSGLQPTQGSLFYQITGWNPGL